MGLKMEVELLHIFLFWRRTMISTVSWHEDKSPSCHETSKHMPHLPKFKVIAALNPNLRLYRRSSRCPLNSVPMKAAERFGQGWTTSVAAATCTPSSNQQRPHDTEGTIGIASRK